MAEAESSVYGPKTRFLFTFLMRFLFLWYPVSVSHISKAHEKQRFKRFYNDWLCLCGIRPCFFLRPRFYFQSLLRVFCFETWMSTWVFRFVLFSVLGRRNIRDFSKKSYQLYLCKRFLYDVFCCCILLSTGPVLSFEPEVGGRSQNRRRIWLKNDGCFRNKQSAHFLHEYHCISVTPSFLFLF